MGRRTLWPFLYTYENYLRSRNRHKSLNYWSQDRGFWAESGILNTILSEVMIDKYGARESFVFNSYSTPIAFLDPAFGGDQCVARFGFMGDVEGGKVGILLTDTVVIEAEADSKDEVDYQIARRFIDECARRTVGPENAGIDATGIGRGVYAITASEWSQRVNRVEFGGGASDLPASADDPRPAKQVYDRKVTELWYSVRELVMAGQLRGMQTAEIVQFCTREYKRLGRLIRIDTKDECKAKLGRSPDNADAVSGLCHVARINGLVAASEITARSTTSWEKMAKENQETIQENYSEENEYVLADA